MKWNGSTHLRRGVVALIAIGCLLSYGAAPAPAAETTGGVEGNTPTSAVTDNDIINFINEQIRAGWKAANITPSARATDAEWCRRVYLDEIGRLPTVAELNAFSALPGTPDEKRAKLLDLLLDSDQYMEEYARNWTNVWSILLVGRPPARRDNRDMVDRDGMNQYLRSAFLRNKPYDQMVRELVSATGSTKPGSADYNGAANFLVNKLAENATEATAKTAKLFLGVQVQCTQCHNHPFNDWKQEQYWGMNAFFRQTRATSTRVGMVVDSASLFNEDFGGEDRGANYDPRRAAIYFEQRNGVLNVAYPTFVDGTEINPSGYVTEVDRRAELADLVVKSDYLGTAIVNRMWGRFLGYGFTKPVDDMGPHNPASHPELLERLGREFAVKGHDLKRLVRWITLSEAYSLSSRTTARNKNDDPSIGETPKFSHFYIRQMEAEQLYESLLVTTQALSGTYEERERTKAMWMQQFTITFGNDEGDEATTFNGTIPQVLMMMNGDLTRQATSDAPGSFLSRMAASGMDVNQQVEFLYLSALARKPTSGELGMAKQLIAARGGNTMWGMQDVWWALLNSNEFIFNH